MLKRFLALSALVACTGFFIGCDKGSSTGSATAKNKDEKKAADDKAAADKKAIDDKAAADKKAADDKAAADKKASDDKLAASKKAVADARDEWAKVFDTKKVQDGIDKLPADKKADAQKKLDDFK